MLNAENAWIGSRTKTGPLRANAAAILPRWSWCATVRMHRAQLARNGPSPSPRHGAVSGSTKNTARHKLPGTERPSGSAYPLRKFKIPEVNFRRARAETDEQCLEAVRAHDRNGDRGVAHQECKDGKQDRKDENRSRRWCQPVGHLRVLRFKQCLDVTYPSSDA